MRPAGITAGFWLFVVGATATPFLLSIIIWPAIIWLVILAGCFALAVVVPRRFCGIFLAIAILVAGIWRFNLARPDLMMVKFLSAKPAPVALIARISSRPELTAQGLTFMTQIKSLANGTPVSGTMLVTTAKNFLGGYDDEISLVCPLQLLSLQKISDHQFIGRGATWLCPEQSVRVVESGHSWYRAVNGWGQAWQNLIQRTLPEPAAGLSAALILGGSQNLSAAVYGQFKRLGLLHIAAVSGFNISLVAVLGLEILLLVGLPRRWAIIVSLLSVLGYAALAGFSGSACRAAVMAVLILVAALLGRLAWAGRAVAVAVAVLVCWQPLWAAFDVGFQLSVAATVGLIYLVPLFLPTTELSGWRESVLTALVAATAAFVATSPLVVYYFQALPLGSIPANLAVAPAIGAMTVMTLTGSLAAWLAPVGSILWFWPAQVLANYIFAITSWLDQLLGGWNIGVSLNGWGMVAIYVVMVLVAWRARVWRAER